MVWAAAAAALLPGRQRSPGPVGPVGFTSIPSRRASKLTTGCPDNSSSAMCPCRRRADRSSRSYDRSNLFAQT
jgi:hypothetical protein